MGILIEWIINIFEFLPFPLEVRNRPDKHLTDVPDGVRSGLGRYGDILFILRTMRAIYKAPSWRDSNQFYRAWLVLTPNRVLMIKSASKLKLFRDIPLNALKSITHEVGDNEYKITFESPDGSDIAEFVGEAAQSCPRLLDLLEDLTAGFETTPLSSDPILKTNSCPHCGVKLADRANYCHECGAKLTP